MKLTPQKFRGVLCTGRILVGRSTIMKNENGLKRLCVDVRADIVEIFKNSKNGHLGGCLSSVEMLVTAYFSDLFNLDPRDSNRDRILIRGHLGPLRASVFARKGWLNPNTLKTYRKFGSILQGHEDMKLVPGVDITPSGSLGMLLSYGGGAAFQSKQTGQEFNVLVFLGDGEEQEGMVSEAARHIATMNLDNIICCIDRNKKQLSGGTSYVDCSDLKLMWSAYGWDVQIVDGHSVYELKKAYSSAIACAKPSLIIADTIKGKGSSAAECSHNGAHTLSVFGSRTERMKKLAESREEIGGNSLLDADKRITSESHIEVKHLPPFLDFPKVSDSILTNCTGSHHQVIASFFREIIPKGYAKNLTLITADLIQKPTRERLRKGFGGYIDVGIREQHAMGMAHGIYSVDSNQTIIIVAGEAFIYRCADQIHAISQSGSHVVILSGGAGLSGSVNGPTHQTSGQAGLITTMPGISYYEPSDNLDMLYSLNEAIRSHGPHYIRLHDQSVDGLPRVTRREGWSEFGNLPNDLPLAKATIVTAGALAYEAVQAQEQLWEEHKIVTKCFNVLAPKKLDHHFASAISPNYPLLLYYDGNVDILAGFVGSVLLSNGVCPPIIKAHGFSYGTTGYYDELLNHFNLDSNSMKQEILEMV